MWAFPPGIQVYGGVKGVVWGASMTSVVHEVPLWCAYITTSGVGGHVHVGDVGVAGVVDRYRRVVPVEPVLSTSSTCQPDTVEHRVHQAGRARVVVGDVLVSRSVQRHGDAVAADAVGLPVDGRDRRTGALIVTISTNAGDPRPSVPLRNGAMTVSPEMTISGPMATVLEVSPVSATGLSRALSQCRPSIRSPPSDGQLSCWYAM